MNENEAKEKLQAYLECQKKKVTGIHEQCNKDLCDNCELCYAQGTTGEHIASVESAIKALEELQQYRAIGTPEECRAAVEKQKAKKPTPIDYEKYANLVDNAIFLRGAYWCPNCKHVVKSGSFCSDCGQKFDWG